MVTGRVSEAAGVVPVRWVESAQLLEVAPFQKCLPHNVLLESKPRAVRLSACDRGSGAVLVGVIICRVRHGAASGCSKICLIQDPTKLSENLRHVVCAVVGWRREGAFFKS